MRSVGRVGHGSLHSGSDREGLAYVLLLGS